MLSTAEFESCYAPCASPNTAQQPLRTVLSKLCGTLYSLKRLLRLAWWCASMQDEMHRFVEAQIQPDAEQGYVSVHYLSTQAFWATLRGHMNLKCTAFYMPAFSHHLLAVAPENGGAYLFSNL